VNNWLDAQEISIKARIGQGLLSFEDHSELLTELSQIYNRTMS